MGDGIHGFRQFFQIVALFALTCQCVPGCSAPSSAPPDVSGSLKRGMTFDAARLALGPASCPATFAGTVSGGVSTLNFPDRGYQVVLSLSANETREFIVDSWKVFNIDKHGALAGMRGSGCTCTDFGNLLLSR